MDLRKRWFERLDEAAALSMKYPGRMVNVYAVTKRHGGSGMASTWIRFDEPVRFVPSGDFVGVLMKTFVDGKEMAKVGAA